MGHSPEQPAEADPALSWGFGLADLQSCLPTSAIVFCLICLDERHCVFCSFKIPALETKPINYRLMFCSYDSKLSDSF